MDILRAKGVTKEYQSKGKIQTTQALKGIDLQLEKGEFVGIMGPSGSGKTTLLNILSGIDFATSGKVEIAGQVINSLSSDQMALFRRHHMGFVFQEFNLLDSLSLKENVMLPLALDKLDVEDIEERSAEVMSMLGINDISDKYPYTVSGGQQQRAAIGRAIINDPDIVFADEPTGNLDSKSSANVMNCLAKLNQKSHCTILVVTHDTFAASYCNRIVFVQDGMVHNEIFKQGSRQDFFRNILHCLEIQGDVGYDF